MTSHLGLSIAQSLLPCSNIAPSKAGKTARKKEENIRAKGWGDPSRQTSGHDLATALMNLLQLVKTSSKMSPATFHHRWGGVRECVLYFSVKVTKLSLFQ